jgi:undecaprenyl-diphosphatase
MLGRMPVDIKEKNLLQAVIVGTVPALILGLILESYMETIFRQPLLVALVLVAGSLLFAYAEYASSFFTRPTEITLKKGLLLGLFQSLALIPGLSRSGATISGGLILGLSRYEATRFSFLLSVPIVLGSGLKKFLELLLSDGAANLMPLAIGAGVSFTVGLIAIHFMLNFVRNHTLWPFVWYRIVLAMVVLIFVFA